MSQRKVTVCDRCDKEIEGKPIALSAYNPENDKETLYADLHEECLGALTVKFTSRARRGRPATAAA